MVVYTGDSDSPTKHQKHYRNSGVAIGAIISGPLLVAEPSSKKKCKVSNMTNGNPEQKSPCCYNEVQCLPLHLSWCSLVPFITLCHHPAFPSHLQMLFVLVDANINRLAQVCASTRNMFHFHTQSLYPIHYRCHYMAPVGIQEQDWYYIFKTHCLFVVAILEHFQLLLPLNNLLMPNLQSMACLSL